MDVNFTLDEIKERDIEVAMQPGQDNILVCTCTGFCSRETGRNACSCRSAQQFCTSSCHRARGTTSLCMNTRCVLQEDSSENDEVLKFTLVFPCGKIFVLLQTCTLFHKLSMFFSYIPSCEAHNNSGLSLRGCIR